MHKTENYLISDVSDIINSYWDKYVDSIISKIIIFLSGISMKINKLNIFLCTIFMKFHLLSVIPKPSLCLKNF